MEIEESMDRNGYCDLHLESKLLGGGQWLAVYARCDPFEYWRCAHPYCNRCYDRKNYGYFNLDRARGSRVQITARFQERCYRHEEFSFDPFMFVGKIGKSRQFQCPIQGCNNVGSRVAEHVADVDEVEAP